MNEPFSLAHRASVILPLPSTQPETYLATVQRRAEARTPVRSLPWFRCPVMSLRLGWWWRWSTVDRLKTI